MKLFLLGNGPSFKSDFLKHEKFFQEKETPMRESFSKYRILCQINAKILYFSRT